MQNLLSPKDLEVVRLVATTGSLTITAKQMYVSQSAISQRLTAMQERIGVELFVRRDGRMHATAAAERLADAAVAVDRLMESAKDDVRELVAGGRRQFRVTTQCHTSYRWLSFVFRDLLEVYPSLSVDVVPEAVEDPYGAVARGEVDIALAFLPDTSSDLPALDLFSDEMFAVMHVDHSLANRRFLNPENFAGEELILYTGRHHDFIDQVLTPAGVAPGRLREVRVTEAIVELSRSGQGIAVLAGWVLNDLANTKDLVAVRIGRGGYYRTWRALVGRQCPEEYVRVFTDSVRRTAAIMAQNNWRDALDRA
jgi:LysR family transcriptional regulator for metE and metH